MKIYLKSSIKEVRKKDRFKIYWKSSINLKEVKM